MELLKAYWPAVAAFAALAATGATWVKRFFNYLRSFLIVTHQFEYEFSGRAPEFFRRNMKQIGGLSRRYATLSLRDRGTTVLVPYNMPQSSTLWWSQKYGFVFLGDMNMTGIKGLTRFDQLAADLAEEASTDAKNVKRSFYVRQVIGTAGDTSADYERKNRKREGGSDSAEGISAAPDSGKHTPVASFDSPLGAWSRERVQKLSQTNAFDGLYYSQKVKHLVADITRWYEQREWYEKHSIPWRTGALLYGPGGTGKSSFPVALGRHLSIPVVQFHAQTMTDAEFIEEWGRLPTPCIVTLEDFDTVFKRRVPQTSHKALSFDTVLNCISGISARSGVITIVNTNDVDSIDEALGRPGADGRSTRPGRLAYCVEMAYCDQEQVEGIATHVLEPWPVLMVSVIADPDNLNKTPNQLQAHCVDLALKELETA